MGESLQVQLCTVCEGLKGPMRCLYCSGVKVKAQAQLAFSVPAQEAVTRRLFFHFQMLSFKVFQEAKTNSM